MALGLTPQQIIDANRHALLRICTTWERVCIKDLAIVQNGYAFSSKFFNRIDGIPLIRIRDIKKVDTENLYSGEYNKEFIVKKNDILIGMDGDFHASKWPGNKGLLNQRVCRLLFSSKYYEHTFFFICLQPYLNAINEETSSVTVKHLSSKTIKDIPLPLPPLPEQRAIVSKIEQLFSSLDQGIADLEKAQAQLKIYRQAVLKKAFEGELTKEWREKQTDLPTADELLSQIKEERQHYYQKQVDAWKKKVKEWEAGGKEGKKPGKPKKLKELPAINEEELKELPDLPNGWAWSKIGNLCQKISDGPFGSHLKTADYVTQGVRVIRLENIKNLFFENSESHTRIAGGLK
ncbi:MAG: restriction endonuclease subunit S [Desulfobacter sp.]